LKVAEGDEFDQFLARRQTKTPATNEASLHDEFDSFLAARQKRQPAKFPWEEPQPEDRIGRAAREYRENTEAIGARPSSATFPLAGYEDAPREKPLIREDPIGTAIGMTSGAKAGSIAARSILGLPVKGALSGAATGLAGSLLGYESSAVPMAMGQAAAVGENPLKAGRQAATDPLALATTGALGALGGAARGASAGIRDPHKLSGRVLQDVEAAGGKVGMGGPRGGLFEAPELTDLQRGRPGINDLASRSAGRIAEDNATRLANARDAFGDAVDQVIASHGDRHIPVTSSHAVLDAIEAENAVNGVVADPKVAAATGRLRQMLTTDTGQLDMAASRATGQPQTIKAPAVKAEDLIKVRKVANRMYRHATEPTDRYVYGKVLDALADDAAAADPRIGEMNANYRREMQSLSTVNDALFGQKRPELRMSEGTTQQAAGRLGRLGDETQAGTLAEARMKAAAAESPQAAREMLLNRAKKAQERLRLGGDETSTNIEGGFKRAVHHGVKRAVSGAVGGFLGHAIGGPLGGAIGTGLGTAAGGVLGNPLALKLRFGLPAADAAARIGGRSAITAGTLVDLARKRREEEQRAAAMLLGGSQ
jgi:hypothetical protein